MNIPPFPAQDLAKLVLGYLAEEQLMTAYDEFLSASPYLDATRNEYDRIFMTSLKNILAEYRAVKIYVETCKPFALRRRLFGCPNLLEIVKFLIQNVDVSKIQGADRSHGSITNQSMDKSVTCAVCNSLRLSSCVCKSRPSAQNMGSSHVEGLQETSVETTSLEDLPGNNSAVRKRHVKTLPKESRRSSLANNDAMDTSDSGSLQNVDYAMSDHCNVPNKTSQNVTAYSSNIPGQLQPSQPNERIDQLNSLTSTCGNNSGLHHGTDTNLISNDKSKITTAGTFADFKKGVNGSENAPSIVPDSSTSENTSVQLIPKESSNTLRTSNETALTNKSITTAHVLLTVTDSIQTQTSLIGKDQMVNIPDNIRHGKDQFGNIPENLRHSKDQLVKITDNPLWRSRERKVTILSDIKVDKTEAKMPVILKNTSSPLMQMQTVLINGTPVYKPQPPVLGTNRNFTKEEIMAMPTIIVVPTSGARIPTCVKPEFVQAATSATNLTTTVSSSASLPPLIIDVPSNSADAHTEPTNNNITQQINNDSNLLVKTVSVPKDNEATVRNTPQGTLPLRKSSSTPRRSTHVRVLDFTTPRRILQETICENTEGSTQKEVILSSSPNLHTLAEPTENVTNESIKSNKTETGEINSSGSLKENDVCPKTGKRNWDADLRAVAIPNSKEALSQVPESRITAGCRRPPKPGVKKNKLSLDKKQHDSKNTSDAKTPKTKKKSKDTKCKCPSDEVKEEEIVVVDDPAPMPMKPTINIITGPDWNSPQETDEKNLSIKSNNADQTDTPDMDRISLQNVIGAKLNISELLETPYKQALYDIQMETPRFLGPDLPDDPMSDIKIMNIPTPRFLNTPKPASTPYTTRLTDYSSGSSYYRPDDQDYLSVDLEISASVNKSKESATEVTVSVEKVTEKKSKAASSKSSRPVRKCTKNVSYVNSPAVKPKESQDKIAAASTSSEKLGVGNAHEMKDDKKSPNTVKETKSKTKRSSTSKKTKTPAKKETPRSFMKIKPRRPTPTRDRGRSRKSSDTRSRKSSGSKDKSEDKTPLVVSAPPKSRRKSSTPRKLHCTKTFNSESSESPDISPKTKEKEVKKDSMPCPESDKIPQNEVKKPPTPWPQDSDSEQLPLRWSDDGSQDSKHSEQTAITTTSLETEDISKIKDYIACELQNATNNTNTKPTDVQSNLHIDLVKRGFDMETAKSIERDLLDETPPPTVENKTSNINMVVESKNDGSVLEKTLDSDASACLKIVQDEQDDDDEDFSVSECYEDSFNYITHEYDETELNRNENPPTKLKDKFSMEICIEDVVVKLRATPLTVLFNIDQKDKELAENSNKQSDYVDNLPGPVHNHRESIDNHPGPSVENHPDPSVENHPNPSVDNHPNSSVGNHLNSSVDNHLDPPIDNHPDPSIDLEPEQYNPKETELAVNSISNFDRLYTPMKDAIRAQVYDIFDSTLTSLDTPLKPSSPKTKQCNTTMTEIVLEVEKVDEKEKGECSKRKRVSGDYTDSPRSSKKPKHDAQSLLNSASNFNFDIESVLYKLHGS